MKLRSKLGINANLLIFSVVKFVKSIYFALPKFLYLHVLLLCAHTFTVNPAMRAEIPPTVWTWRGITLTLRGIVHLLNTAKGSTHFYVYP